MLTEFILSFAWLAVAFVLSTQVLITEFRRIDCIHSLFESTRAELERRGLKEVHQAFDDRKKSPSTLPDFDFMNQVIFRETPETLEGTMLCSGTSAFEKVTLRKLK